MTLFSIQCLKKSWFNLPSNQEEASGGLFLSSPKDIPEERISQIPLTNENQRIVSEELNPADEMRTQMTSREWFRRDEQQKLKKIFFLELETIHTKMISGRFWSDQRE